MNRYGGDYNQGRSSRYGRDHERWSFSPGYDRGHGFQGQQMGNRYGQEYMGQDRNRGYRPDHTWFYDRNYNQGYSGGGYNRGYDQGYAGGRHEPSGRYDRNMGGGYPQGDRPWMHTRPWTSPWAERIPGQSYGYGFGFGMGRNPYIYK